MEKGELENRSSRSGYFCCRERYVKRDLFFLAIKPEMGDHNLVWTADSLIIDGGLSNTAMILGSSHFKVF
jgi:hypothetical protein